jgi:hypothetical protein
MDSETIAEQLETASAPLSDDLASRVIEVLHKARPEIAVTASGLRSVEGLLHLADSVVPGWSIGLHGKALEPDGHWRCTLRETMSSDSDAYIGYGKAQSLNSAILAAIVRVAAYQARS